MSDFEQNYEFKQFQIRIQKVYFHLLHVIAVHSNRVISPAIFSHKISIENMHVIYFVFLYAINRQFNK